MLIASGALSASFTSRFQTPSFKPEQDKRQSKGFSAAAPCFQGCDLSKRLEASGGISFGFGILSLFGSLITFIGANTSGDPYYSLPMPLRQACSSIDSVIHSETAKTAYTMPEMRTKAFDIQKEELSPCLEEALMGVIDLSENSLEHQTMRDKLVTCLRDDKRQNEIAQAKDKAAQALIELGIETLHEKPDAEKAIFKTLGQDVLKGQVSPEFQARYNALLDEAYQRVSQDRVSDANGMAMATQASKMLFVGSAGLFSVAGLFGFALTRHRRKLKAMGMN